MFDYIEKLRAKKPHEKQAIALTATFVLTGIIVLCWIATLPYQFSSFQAENTAGSSTSQSQDIVGSFGQMWAKAAGSYQDIKTGVQASWNQVK